MAIPGVDKDMIKTLIGSAREQIGRNITIKTPIRLACSICTASGYYDSVTDNSYYFTCPECKGTFWKDEMAETEILARVHWTTNEAINVTPGGKFFSGEAYIHVDPDYHTLLQECQNGGTVVVDGQDMTIIRINPEGTPEINRYKAILRGVGNTP